MGLFGSGDKEPTQAEQLAEKQYEQNQAEIEQKRKDLYQQRLDIIKSQGGQNWTPNREAPSTVREYPVGRPTGYNPGYQPYPQFGGKR